MFVALLVTLPEFVTLVANSFSVLVINSPSPKQQLIFAEHKACSECTIRAIQLKSLTLTNKYWNVLQLQEQDKTKAADRFYSYYFGGRLGFNSLFRVKVPKRLTQIGSNSKRIC